MAQDKVVRTALLTAQFANGKVVDRVEIKSIDLPANTQVGLHLHPCPVVGIVVQGKILFQVEGQEQQVLNSGDAFHEPANVHIPHFDSLDEPARFIAFYLLGEDESELIRML